MTRNFDFDELKFGNPTLEQKNTLEKETFLDVLIPDFTQKHFPSNSSPQTKLELNEITSRISDISIEENSSHLRRYLGINQNTLQFLINNLSTSTLDVTDLLESLNRDISPLVLKLQFHFQRPTPKMLAVYYKLKLFPLSSPKSETPSYPSKEAILVCLLSEILSNHAPDRTESNIKIKEYVLSALATIGNHYISDINFSIDISDAIIKNKDFTKKYNI